ncbi:MAG: hypothetical protein DME76_16955 [Verrucomicrobia bacterium]|nr:MAG: hypothetical protein DME76_16955 [Verrucomicrobiota bacterium]
MVDSSMGTFRVDCTVRNYAEPEKQALVRDLLVDTGSDSTWISENTLTDLGIARQKKDLSFVMANGEIVTRSVGFAIIRIDNHFTIDEVVFAQPGDLLLLGARTLEGLDLRVDPRAKKLVAAGPRLAA